MFRLTLQKPHSGSNRKYGLDVRKTGGRGNPVRKKVLITVQENKLRLWNKQQQENRGEDGFKNVQEKMCQYLRKWDILESGGVWKTGGTADLLWRRWWQGERDKARF